MLKARFLGGASLRLDDTPIGGPASHRHPLALLAILAAHPVREVSRDQLITLLWPDRASSRSRHLLSEALYVLRNALGRDGIRSVGSSLAVNPYRIDIDVHLFREAVEAGDHRAAVEAYGGDFLDGFHLQDSAEFQHWVDGRRLHFASRHAAAVDALAAAATAAGNPLEAVHWHRMRLAQDPFSGSSTHRLMTALARAGDRAEAIRVGREYERRLRDELGLPPSEEVTLLRAHLEGPHWVAPGPAPSRWHPIWSRDRRAASRIRPISPELDDPLPPATEGGVPEPPPLVRRSSLAVLVGPVVGLIVVLALAAALAGGRVLWWGPWGPFWGLGEARAYRVAVLPLSACCSEDLADETGRLTLILSDTLALVPGQALLEPGRVLAAWHKAVETSGAPVPERFAADIGARRYVTGSVVEVGTPDVRVEVSLRDVGSQSPIYVTRGTAGPEGVSTLLQRMAGSLAEYLRGEAAGRGLEGAKPRVRDLSGAGARALSGP